MKDEPEQVDNESEDVDEKLQTICDSLTEEECYKLMDMLQEKMKPKEMNEEGMNEPGKGYM